MRFSVALWGVLLALASSVNASEPSTATIRVGIYGPVQRHSPLRVAGFRYSRDAVQVVLVNQSDKVVEGVIVVATFAVPSGCAVDPPIGQSAGGGRLDRLHIEPHASGITTVEASPFSPTSLVVAAKDLRTAYLHVQAAVAEADFTDGSKWRPQIALPHQPYDPSLIKADADRCSDPTSAVEALSKVSKLGFHADSRPVNILEEKASVPHLWFACSLEESEAICPDSLR